MEQFDDTSYVFPASAGMIPRPGCSRIGRASVPRKRGDDPAGQWGIVRVVGCSPQARG